MYFYESQARIKYKYCIRSMSWEMFYNSTSYKHVIILSQIPNMPKLAEEYHLNGYDIIIIVNGKRTVIWRIGINVFLIPKGGED